ncbi:MAG: glycosyltransferase family 2 protein, partial [Patescibacteria group bacterium]
HLIVSGKTGKLKNDFVDDNKNGLQAWVAKHRNYALREAEDVLAGNYGLGKKRNLYYRMPPFLRVFGYYIYRYFFRLGFLDGIPGLVFHFLHGFWYRFLVDAKIYERRKRNQIRD